ncbi:TetR/AcrR family transcriptional regulator [Thiomonas intermedia]|uniref:TetR/AcrR family transcriptional regulator n=1 Tax=Thiomonas intermedia TaxID=926 RepID=UPI0014749FDC|nr:TetR/AcrR family transcriptional regulator [Thiomonas intermedia]
MRVTRQEMDASHDRILDGAARLFRERGLRDTSVADAMKAAGMTHGGFYRHFSNKDDLVVESLRVAFDEFARPLELRPDTEPPSQVAADFKTLYLSDEHVANPGLGCPMPALGSDLARESEQIKTEFSAGLRRVIDALARCKDGSEPQRRAAAAREVAMLVGAVVLARASKGEVSRLLLDACRNE